MNGPDDMLAANPGKNYIQGQTKLLYAALHRVATPNDRIDQAIYPMHVQYGASGILIDHPLE